MSEVKVKRNSSGIKELLKSEGLTLECKKCANDVRSKAGEGFGVSKRTYPERIGFAVHPIDAKAASKNYKENILEKAIRK